MNHGAMTDSQQVAQLLTAAIETHKAACTARQKKQANAQELLVKARDLRVQAETLDPTHEAPAWGDEQAQTPLGQDTHGELMAFYAKYIR
jgi:hypothetical protein